MCALLTFGEFHFIWVEAIELAEMKDNRGSDRPWKMPLEFRNALKLCSATLELPT